MLILVTGGAGFIGSHFVRYWLSRHPKDTIINLDFLTYAGNLENLNDVTQQFGARYRFVKGSIGNFDLVYNIISTFEPQIVVNFGAESHNSRSVQNPSVFYQTNVLGTQVLLEVSRQLDVPRFHHISTCEVYGELPLDSKDGFPESSPIRPRTPYSASKAAADIAVRAYYETFNLPITISNCSNNYGPYQFPEKVIPRFIISGIIKEKLTIYKSSHFKREWLHVLDHCRAIELILQNGDIGETYNIGSEVEIDVETIADTILSKLGLDESYKMYVADRPGHDCRYLLNSTKIKSDLGWKSTKNFDEGIDETIDWYKNNRQWWQKLRADRDIDESNWQAEK